MFHVATRLRFGMVASYRIHGIGWDSQRSWAFQVRRLCGTDLIWTNENGRPEGRPFCTLLGIKLFR